MGIVEVSIAYGVATGMLKSGRSTFVAAVLFAFGSFFGLLFSPLGLSASLQVLLSAWLVFNISLFTVMFSPLLLEKSPAQRTN